MMKHIEPHVTSLELSKRLKEVGVVQESVFYWNANTLDDNGDPIWELSRYPNHINGYVSAFLVSELMDMVVCEGHIYTEMSKNYEGTWSIKLKEIIEHGETRIIQAIVHGKSTADRLAEMVLYLIETGVVTPGGE